ncbi:hypothetical protein DRP04_13250 [Archaeoglobales archaeon]|nr:MAG: hypothetical protein DRP04_13250 [Archaeoglobales archaeon]
MKVNKEICERFEKLRNILKDEVERIERTAKKDRAPAYVESQTSDVAIIKTDMPFSPGDLVGIWESEDYVKPIGFIVKKIEGKFGEIAYVLNTHSIGGYTIPERFYICKADYLYLLRRRIDVLGRAEEILSKFEFVEPKEYWNFEHSQELDEYEKRAAGSSLSLNDGELLLVMGPPGTGKTQFISVASMILGEKKKVFVTSHSHQAVDNVFERLPDIDYALRIGPITKVSEKVKRFSPEHRYLEGIPENLSYDELAEIYSEAFKNIRRVQDNILYRDNFLVGATAAKSITNPLRGKRFDTVFVDEAHNLCISTALLVLERARKAVVTGDIWQVPPVYTYVSPVERPKYGTFNILYELLKNEMKELLWLKNHYRSNERIISFSSKFVYDNNINVSEKCKNEKLRINNVRYRWLDPEEPLIFVHINGEEEIDDKRSRFNDREAKAVAWIVCELIRAGVKEEDIVVLTPFGSQVKKIEDTLREEIINRGLPLKIVDVKTVHSYLGGERDVVVFSVTATYSTSLDFIDKRMINVVVTRAKKKLIVVGNRRKIVDCQDKPIFELYRYIAQNGILESE